MTPAALRAIRARLGWSQEQLAEALGRHRVTIAKWESGTHPISAPVARLVERVASDSANKHD